MDPLSIAASVFAIIQIADRVAAICKSYIDAVADCPKELRIIFIETKSLTIVCQGLQFLKQDNAEDTAIITQLAGSDGPIEECEKIVKELESLLPAPTLPANTNREARMQKLNSALDALAWARRSGKARSLLEDVVRLKTTMTLAIAGSLFQDVQYIKQALSDSQISEICQWLQNIDPSPQHNAARGLRQQGTGDWVFECEQWNNWINLKTRCLRIHGIRGAGKTVLAAHLIEQVSQMCERLNDRKVSCFYYYCSYKRDLDEAAPFLRWLISQLCRQKNDVPTSASKLFQSRMQPSLQQLLATLYDLLTDMSRVYVIIDAIDEGNQHWHLLDPDDVSPRRNLLRVTQDLMTDARFVNLQLLITSGPNVHVEATMADIAEPISLSNSMVEEDVRLYIMAQLRSEPRFRDWPQSLRDDLEGYLCQNVKSGFRCVDNKLRAFQEYHHLDDIKEDLSHIRKELATGNST